MAEAVTENIKEGFLCPVCHKDLRSPNNLLAHFQDLHSEEQDLLKSIKGRISRLTHLTDQGEKLFFYRFSGESQEENFEA